MKGGINFEEWKEIVKKNRRSLRSKSNIFRFEPESLTYGAEKAVKSPEYGQVHTITYNITGDIDTTGWPTEIKSGKTLTLSGITTPYGGGMAFDSNQPYQYSSSTGKLTINDVLKDLTVNITIIPPMYENASVGDYLYDDWTFGKTEKEGWIARCAGTNGSGENKKTVWCSRATGTDLKWSTEWVDTGLTNYSTSIDAETDMSGKENTALLVSLGTDKYEAAAWAAQQFNGLGYLPSVGEWDKYREKLYYYEAAYRGFWWTSTEESDTAAYVLTENNYFSRESKKSLSYYNNDYSKNNVKAFCQLSGPCGKPVNNNGHAYVDLGLPSGTLWASMNVGASSVTDGGTSFTVRPGTVGVSTTENDTAYLNWGGNWRIPTQQQFNELFNNCTYELFTTIDGSDNQLAVHGCKFTSNVNGNVLFWPLTAGDSPLLWINEVVQDEVETGDLDDLGEPETILVNGCYAWNRYDGTFYQNDTSTPSTSTETGPKIRPVMIP